MDINAPLRTIYYNLASTYGIPVCEIDDPESIGPKHAAINTLKARVVAAGPTAQFAAQFGVPTEGPKMFGSTMWGAYFGPERPGIERAVIVPIMPALSGKGKIIITTGANAQTSSHHIYEKVNRALKGMSLNDPLELKVGIAITAELANIIADNNVISSSPDGVVGTQVPLAGGVGWIGDDAMSTAFETFQDTLKEVMDYCLVHKE
jgi:hypothetical protein